MPEVFLSYSRDDQPMARRFAEALQREGFEVWWDQALSVGEAFDQVTEKALEEARAVVVLWSKRSVDSRWVRAEATQAQANHRLVPVMIEPCKRPIMFELTHTADLAGWNGDTSEEGWRSLVDGLRRLVGKPASAIEPGKAPAAAAAPEPRSRRGFVIAAAAIAVALVLGLLWYLHGRGVPAPEPSIAVLPFKDLSDTQDQGYFADGVTEEILNSLAGLKDLKVTARTSAFAFKGKDVDLREVGKTLGVANILEGSIRKDGDQLRITAQLIDVRSDTHLWSKTYDRPRQDIFKVQEEVARQVAEALQVTLGVGFGNEPGMTRDVDAYEAYLAAKALPFDFKTDTGLQRIGRLQEAVAKDPTFATAWGSLADEYGGMANLAVQDKQSWLSKSEAAFGKSLENLASSPGVAEVQLARRSLDAGHWKETGEHFRAAALEPAKSGRGIQELPGYSFLLLSVGRGREAVAILELEKARDPLNVDTAFRLAWAYADAGNLVAAVAETERGYRLGGPNSNLMTVAGTVNAMGARDPNQIKHWLDAQVAVDPNAVGVAGTRRLLSLQDQPEKARALLKGPALSGMARIVSANWMLYYGDTEAALENLRLTLEQGPAVFAAMVIWHPNARDARRTPAFKKLVRDAGFVDYWKEFGWGDFCKPVGTDDFECH